MYKSCGNLIDLSCRSSQRKNMTLNLVSVMPPLSSKTQRRHRWPSPYIWLHPSWGRRLRSRLPGVGLKSRALWFL